MRYRVYDKQADYMGRKKYPLIDALKYMFDCNWECIVENSTGKLVYKNPDYMPGVEEWDDRDE